MSTAIRPALPKPTKKRKNARKIQPLIQPPWSGVQRHYAGGKRDIHQRGDENFTSADAIGHPTPKEGARHRAEARRQQDDRGLAVGQLPSTDDERQHIADQKEIEEIEHVAEVRSGNDLPLIARQCLLALQELQHGVASPFGRWTTTAVALIVGPWRAKSAPKPPAAARPGSWLERTATRLRWQYPPKPTRKREHIARR